MLRLNSLKVSYCFCSTLVNYSSIFSCCIICFKCFSKIQKFVLHRTRDFSLSLYSDCLSKFHYSWMVFKLFFSFLLVTCKSPYPFTFHRLPTLGTNKLFVPGYNNLIACIFPFYLFLWAVIHSISQQK